MKTKEIEEAATFEQAIEAVKAGHQVTHEHFDDFCKSTIDIIHQCNEWLYPKEALTGWAIIKKPTDKELLIEHFKKDGAKPVLILTYSGKLKLVTDARGLSIKFEQHNREWANFFRIATKEEALSLVLDKGEL